MKPAAPRFDSLLELVAGMADTFLARRASIGYLASLLFRNCVSSDSEQGVDFVAIYSGCSCHSAVTRLVASLHSLKMLCFFVKGRFYSVPNTLMVKIWQALLTCMFASCSPAETMRRCRNCWQKIVAILCSMTVILGNSGHAAGVSPSLWLSTIWLDHREYFQVWQSAVGPKAMLFFFSASKVLFASANGSRNAISSFETFCWRFRW